MNSNNRRTPGYNCRLTIRFSADKNGRPLAHYWSHNRLSSGRWIRLGYDEAKMFVAQGQAGVMSATRWARPCSGPRVQAESAETVYMRQHATITEAIARLQATLDLMQAPDKSDAPITWGDVAEFAHVAEAATGLVERLS
jgi:hypothetical protein